MTRPARGEIAHDLAYDLSLGVGWLMGSVAVLFARPIAWIVFHDWSQPLVTRHGGRLQRFVSMSKRGRQ